jgi:hypothetical protein
MRESQARFEGIVSTAASITGHQKLHLLQEIADAEAKPIVVPHPGLRGVTDTKEVWRWVSRGKTIATELHAELAAFDTEVELYNPSIGSRPVLGLVRALGHQASFARHLAGSGMGGCGWSTIAEMIKTREPIFAAARERCERLIEAETSAVEALELFKPIRYRGIGSSIARDIHAVLFPDYLDDRFGHFRAHDGGFDPEMGLLGLPEAEGRGDHDDPEPD